ncbi:DUF29 domain-containing protein [Crocosphaera sp. XPORK-15E]|uniref:DUF29 domain-containing protein n=1 Tax=Crocosphaera sp. XPORK-15E TaxID=3110247 RepID=UPI002B1FFBD2|nr:DUF29 domain-containing protein [Crocosphaera sp. XPORK-15E]MEA5535064.1 DUF29 domain-containing protein [Crocosphaera sp. XPORK-15E]
MTQNLKINPQKNHNLYDKDYYLWIVNTIKLLSQEKFTEIDLVNLIEEMEDMGRSEKKSVTSNLRILLMHLLKYQYQAEKRSNSWLFTIVEHRKRLKESFQTSPSLKRYFIEVFEECYQDSRDLAAAETGLPLQTFPETSPFTPENTLNPDYLP